MTGTAVIVQGDALHLPLPDGSVDLVVTSPPYFSLRSYGAGPGEIGSESTPQAFLEALWQATAEMARVLKPGGSIFVNLGDKYSTGNSGQSGMEQLGARYAGGGHTDQHAKQASRPVPGLPPKCLLLLPERYRIGCVDRLGLIARAVIVWDKPNGLPESVTDRVRRSHEDWVHLVKQPRYYSATDEIREPQTDRAHHERYGGRYGRRDDADPTGNGHTALGGVNPLGKLPGSVWSIPSEPLTLPGYFTFQDGALLDFLAPERGSQRPKTNGHHPGLFDLDPYLEAMTSGDAGAWRWMRATGATSSPWPQTDTGLQLRTAASHYAAFPTRWPEQLIKGFSPPGICVECGAGRVPVVERATVPDSQGRIGIPKTGHSKKASPLGDFNYEFGVKTATILGYACACTPHTLHPGSGESSGLGHNRPDSGIDQGDGYANVGAGWGGKSGYSNRPKVGPWREYHLSGWQAPPTRPSVILDPFSGTGTTPMVARALGRIGIGVDLSAAYCRAARWRVRYDGAKAISRTNLERQQELAL